MTEFNEAIGFVHSSNKARMHEKKKQERSEKICDDCKGNHYLKTNDGHVNCPKCVCNTYVSASFTNENKSSTT